MQGKIVEYVNCKQKEKVESFELLNSLVVWTL